MKTSEPQYRQKFKQWKIRKYVPAKVKRCVSRKLHENPRRHSFILGLLPISEETRPRQRHSNVEFDPATSPTTGMFPPGLCARSSQLIYLATPSQLTWISPTPSLPSPGPFFSPQSPSAEPRQAFTIDGMLNLFKPDDPIATERLGQGGNKSLAPTANNTPFDLSSLPSQSDARLTHWLDQTFDNTALSPPPSESWRALPSPASPASSSATSEQPGISESNFDKFFKLSRTASRLSSVASPSTQSADAPSPVLSSMSDTSAIMGIDQLELEDAGRSRFREDLEQEHERLQAAAPSATVDTYPDFDGAPIGIRVTAFRAAHPESPPLPPPPSPASHTPPPKSYKPNSLGSSMVWYWYCSECKHINNGALACDRCLECSHTRCVYCESEITQRAAGPYRYNRYGFYADMPGHERVASPYRNNHHEKKSRAESSGEEKDFLPSILREGLTVPPPPPINDSTNNNVSHLERADSAINIAQNSALLAREKSSALATNELEKHVVKVAQVDHKAQRPKAVPPSDKKRKRNSDLSLLQVDTAVTPFSSLVEQWDQEFGMDRLIVVRDVSTKYTPAISGQSFGRVNYDHNNEKESRLNDEGVMTGIQFELDESFDVVDSLTWASKCNSQDENKHNYAPLTVWTYVEKARIRRGLLDLRSAKVLIPVHIEEHWVLVHIDCAESRVRLYDSSQVEAQRKITRETVLEDVKQFLSVKDELKGVTWGYTQPSANTYARQQNNIDCGLFVIAYARCIVTGEDPQGINGRNERRILAAKLFNGAFKCRKQWSQQAVQYRPTPSACTGAGLYGVYVRIPS